MSNKKSVLTNQFYTFRILALIELSAAILFSFFNISFHADISLLAFPLALAYTAVNCWFLAYKLVFKTDGTHILAAIKLTEYLPYFLFITFILRRAGKEGTPYFVDVVSVILWFVIFILAYFSTRNLYPKKNEKIIKGWAVVPVEKSIKV